MIKTQNNKYLLVTCCDDRYMPGCLVMLYTLKKHMNKFLDKYCDIHVMYDPLLSTISKENQELAKKILPKIKFEKIDQSIYRKVPVLRKNHRPALLTIESFRHRPKKNYEKVIFFDTDMICLRGIEEAILKCKKDICGVPCGSHKAKKKSINTGFFILNKKIIKDNKSYYELLGMVKRLTGEEKYLDQPIINKWIIKRKDISLKLLPYEYNQRSGDLSYYRGENIKVFMTYPIILHFTGKGVTKPWLFKEQIDKDRNKKYPFPKAYNKWYKLEGELKSSNKF